MPFQIIVQPYWFMYSTTSSRLTQTYMNALRVDMRVRVMRAWDAVDCRYTLTETPLRSLDSGWVHCAPGCRETGLDRVWRLLWNGKWWKWLMMETSLSLYRSGGKRQQEVSMKHVSQHKKNKNINLITSLDLINYIDLMNYNFTEIQRRIWTIKSLLKWVYDFTII